MATAGEIDDAVTSFREAGGEELILLHCTSSYPTPHQDINLRRIPLLMQAFESPVGFSDHSEGSAAAIAAVALGACFIEKHFTIDRNLPGPDHWFSSDPKEMKQLIAGVRQAEAALGSSRLAPAPSEKKNRVKFRLSCVAARKLAAGTVIGPEDIAIKRPGSGIPPKLKDSINGLVLKYRLEAGNPFKWEDFNEY
jgi:N-acetylneuraminate synthase/N,N'-diacetyllegionaminate synthase